MNYKNWDNRKTNRGRGRSNWNWRGRGYNRMTNPFLQNLSWSNPSQNYNQYHSIHHEATTHFQNSRLPRLPILPTSIANVIVSKPVSPLPGSEEYTQNKIQQTSDLIKRQLNIDSETCASDFSSSLTLSDSSNNNVIEEHESSTDLDSTTRPSESKKIVKQPNRKKSPEIIDVQDIHNRIIKHISNLSYSKKMNLVNQSTMGYDIAIQEVQKQKRLELSRALRDISKRQSQSSDDGEVINAILPDIGIKIEDLPNDVIAELSNSLNLHLEDQVTNLVDPEVCFKQAEKILNVDFEGDESNLKVFQHNLRINDCISSQISNSSSIRDNMHTNDISTDYNLLNKSDREYHLDGNAFENIPENYEPHTSKENVENMFFDSNDTHNNDEDGEDDYSKDVEFNNFCFENLDVTKSYLAPFTSTKPNPQDFANDATLNNISERLPKISVRKDILLDATTDSDGNINVETLKSQSTSHSPVDISHSEESQKVIVTDDSENFKSIIESTNYLNKLQKQTLNEFTRTDDSIIHCKDTKYDSNWRNESNINKNHTEVNELPISVKIINDSNASLTESHTKEENVTLNTKDDLKLSNIVQKIETASTPVPELQNLDKILHTLDNSLQKRWKSPGEKKMMADIHIKSNISKNSEQTLNNTILEQMEEFNKKMMIISTKSCIDNFRKESENSVNINSKATNDRLPHDYFSSTDLLTNSPVQASEFGSNLNNDNIILNTVELSKSPLHEPVFSKTIKSDILIKEMDHMSNNIQQIQTDDKHLITCTNNSEATVSIVETEDNLNLDSNEKSYVKSREIITDTKENSSANEENEFVCVKEHTHDDEQNERISKPKSDMKKRAKKQHRYKKSRCKNNHPTSSDEHNISKQKFTKADSSNIIVLNDFNKNALNIKSDTNKTDKLDSEKTEKNEGCRKIKTAAEKKETLPILKSAQNVCVQTDFENDLKTEEYKLQLKEYTNAEIQTSNLLISSSVQTNADLGTCNTEVKHRNYMNYLLKLKEIDEEIEKLMNMKKKLYENMEYAYNTSHVANCLSAHQTIDSCMGNTNQVIHDMEMSGAIHEKNSERSVQKEFTDVVTRKHKKTDSDTEYQEDLHSPKRKKRHRNIEKNIYSDSSAKSQLSNSNNINSLKSLNGEVNHCTNIRKPLSIKISLKNITQSSSMGEIQKTTNKLPEQRIFQKINTKHLEDTSTSNNSKSTNKQSISVEKQSRKRNSGEKKFEMDNRGCTKQVSVCKLSSESDTISNNVDLFRKSKNYIKVGKNKKVKISKHDTYDTKLYENNGRIFNKSCHVVIERFTLEYLENLRKSLRETKHESQKCYITEEEKANNMETGNSAPKTCDVCDPNEISIGNIHVNCDQNSIDFKNITGAVLDMQVVEDLLLAGTDSGHLYFCNVNTGDNISSISVSDKPLTSIYTIVSGEHCNIYAGCLNGNLSIIDFKNKQVSDIVQYEEGIQCIEKGWEFLFMGSNRGQVMRYNFKKTKQESSIKIYDSNIFAIKATQEGARRVILVASRNAQITVRDAISGLLLRTMDSTFYPTVYTILLENNLVYCGTSQHNILIYTFQDGQLSHKYEAINSKGIVCLKATGNLLFAGCYNGNIYVYNIHLNKYLGEITGPGGMLLSMYICGNKIIVGTKSNKLRSLMIPQVYLDQLSS